MYLINHLISSKLIDYKDKKYMYEDINLVCSLGYINYKGNNASVRVYKYINSYEVVILTDDGFTLYSKMFTTSYPSNINDAIKHAENLVR